MTEPVISHPAPHRGRISLKLLAFGTIAPPVLWFAQEMLGYGISAMVCYRGDHPTTIHSTSLLRAGLLGFSGLALAVAIVSGIVSYIAWRSVKEEKEGDYLKAIDIGDGRTRFLALWGMMTSLWFFFAILFETVAAGMAPLCPA